MDTDEAKCVKTEIKSKLPQILEHFGCKRGSNSPNWECANHKSEGKNSLSVDENDCVCNCFGCDLRGDSFSVIAEFSNLDIKKDFKEIMKSASDITGVKLGEHSEKITKEIQEERKRIEIIKETHKAVVETYSMKHAPEHIRQYIMKKRGITTEELDCLGLAYIPKESWNKNKIKELVPESENIFFEVKGEKKYLLNTYYAMQNRIIHPHRYRGEILYLTGEITPDTKQVGDTQGKYVKINRHFSGSGNAEGYNLECLLEGKREYLIFSEGFWDTLQLKLAGIPTIAFGTSAISEYFVEKYYNHMKKFKKIVICFDTEDNLSGRKGALSVALRLLKRGIHTIHISELQINEGKLDIDEFLQKWKTTEDKKNNIQKEIINKSESYYAFLIKIIEKSEKLNAEPLFEELLYVSSLYGSVVRADIHNTIRKKLGLNKKELQEAYNKVIGEKTEQIEREECECVLSKLTYALEPHGSIHLLTKIPIFKKNGEYLRDEEETLLLFSSATLKRTKHFDNLTNKITKKTIIELKHGGSRKIKYNLEETKNWSELAIDVFEKCSPTTLWKKHLAEYVEKVSVFLKDEIMGFIDDDSKQIESTNMYGVFYIHKKLKVYTADNCELQVDESDEKNLSDVIEEENKLSAIQQDDEIIKKWLLLLKKIPTTEYGSDVLWNILSFSLVSYLRVPLFKLGIDIAHDVVIVGPKNEGKTNLYIKPLVTNLWGIATEKNTQILGGTGIRLKYACTGTTRPQTIDEMKAFGTFKSLHDLIKQKSTSIMGAPITRGKKDGSVSNYYAIRTLFCSSNSLTIDDVALRQRIYAIPVMSGLRKENTYLSEEELDFFQSESIRIGKSYQEYLQENGTVLISKIKEIIVNTKEDARRDKRTANITRYLEIGKYIICELYKKHGIKPPSLEKVKIFPQDNIENITNTSLEHIQSNVWKILRERHRIAYEKDVGTKTQVVYEDYSALEILKKYRAFPDDPPYTTLYEKLSSNGVYFVKKYAAFALTGKAFISKFNEIAKTPIGTVKDLTTQLQDGGWENIKYLDTHSKISVMGDTRVKCALIISLQNIDGDELEIDKESITKQNVLDKKINEPNIRHDFLEKAKETIKKLKEEEDELVPYGEVVMGLRVIFGVSQKVIDDKLDKLINEGYLVERKPGYLDSV